MGTRHLTMVIKNSKPVVAQYGQWDGYPGGQGRIILNFLKTHNMEIFATNLAKVRFANGKDDSKKLKFCESIGSKDGSLNMSQAQVYFEKYPYDSRDIGGDILEKIYNSKDKEIVLVDSSEFAKDSLFCEWAWVVNLDNMTLEVYDGFHKFPIRGKTKRFGTESNDNGYLPVMLLHIFDLNNLPDAPDFVELLDKRANNRYNREQRKRKLVEI